MFAGSRSRARWTYRLMRRIVWISCGFATMVSGGWRLRVIVRTALFQVSLFTMASHVLSCPNRQPKRSETPDDTGNRSDHHPKGWPPVQASTMPSTAPVPPDAKPLSAKHFGPQRTMEGENETSKTPNLHPSVEVENRI